MDNRQETHEDFEVNSYCMLSFDPICVFTTTEDSVTLLSPTKMPPLLCCICLLWSGIKKKEKQHHQNIAWLLVSRINGSIWFTFCENKETKTQGKYWMKTSCNLRETHAHTTISHDPCAFNDVPAPLRESCVQCNTICSYPSAKLFVRVEHILTDFPLQYHVNKSLQLLALAPFFHLCVGFFTGNTEGRRNYNT